MSNRYRVGIIRLDGYRVNVASICRTITPLKGVVVPLIITAHLQHPRAIGDCERLDGVHTDNDKRWVALAGLYVCATA